MGLSLWCTRLYSKSDGLYTQNASCLQEGEGPDMVIVYKLPLAEVIGTHFHDKIKAATSGFASFDYKERGYERASIQKMNVLLNSDPGAIAH